MEMVIVMYGHQNNCEVIFTKEIFYKSKNGKFS